MRVKIGKIVRISMPREIGRRFSSASVELDDNGDHIVIRPAECDPIVAAYGS